MDLKDIKAIIDLMKKNSVTEFELEKQDFKIRLKRGSNGSGAAVAYDDPPALAHAQPAPAIPAAAPAAPAASARQQRVGDQVPHDRHILPGTLAGIGSLCRGRPEVNPETVVCIIEAMKVMNEIKAEAKGVITQVLVENAKPVEFGQPLFKIRPS